MSAVHAIDVERGDRIDGGVVVRKQVVGDQVRLWVGSEFWPRTFTLLQTVDLR
jgi:hypothetical protein